MLVNELSDGTEIDQVLLVRAIERRSRRDGGDYLRLQLGDRTGAVASMVWEELVEMERLATPGAPVHVSGRYTVHPRFGPQINLRSLAPAEPGSFSLEDLLDGPPRSPEQMEVDLRELIATVRNPISVPCSSWCSERTHRYGRATRWPRLPSTTTRPTVTDCSSTAWEWPRA